MIPIKEIKPPMATYDRSVELSTPGYGLLYKPKYIGPKTQMIMPSAEIKAAIIEIISCLIPNFFFTTYM